MTLGDYLNWRKISTAEFGQLIGRNRVSVERYRDAKQWPPREIMERIREVTSGHVTAEDFLSSQLSGRGARAA